MAMNFMRLYKGITDESEKKVNVIGHKLGLMVDHTDLTHEFERRQILHKLGYKVGIKDPKRLERNWHHGKAARDKIEKKMKGDEDPQLNFQDWKQEYQQKLIEINRLSIRDKATKKAVEGNKRIPSNVWQQFCISSRNVEKLPSPGKRVGQLPPLKGTNSDATGGARHSPSSSSPPLVGNIRGEPMVYMPVHDEEFPAYRDTTLRRADNQWTEKEKKRINDLYWEINRPKNDSPVAWDIYYQIFVARFLESFPHRDAFEVKRKIQSMLTKRQLKMEGEVEYWDEVHKSSSTIAVMKAKSFDRLAPKKVRQQPRVHTNSAPQIPASESPAGGDVLASYSSTH